MDAYDAIADRVTNDEAVSPVIAVILMVAITVVLAATVYVWVSGFASEDQGPEQASATAEGASVGGDDVNWVRVSLTRGENAPYDEGQASYTVLDPNGNSNTPQGADSDDKNDKLCTSANAESGNVSCTSDFHVKSTSNTWDVGEVLYIPCQAAGDHSVTISVEDTAILDSTVECDASA
jgi:flagellin-like protein